ncbi:Deoxyuridine 5'-triphosphate nucleotidohydrolase [Buchnera aphidicola (Cinara splendens)]|uniref:Deoxyuridine 5'-triphosphate nucleotidohydrolase, partial n=1 Tax=Buchnera aphidicola (Cinara splendens) TaxID=2518979 RepID=A0A451DEP6_9GAMM|nr:dUTP diphosphatase [Buchnera aphidicola]VFP85119.1 Deoxyuridine 5'-triphosphate nucleotidohydrolase [Buchnera aphidicola (Cinara splendens)]
MCINVLIINVKFIDPSIKKSFNFPEYLCNGLSGFFLRAYLQHKICLFSKKTTLISTGLFIQVMDKTVRVVIEPITTINNKYPIIIGNPFNFMDFFDFFELKISLWNCSKKNFYINPGDKIAQLSIVPNKKIKFLYI